MEQSKKTKKMERRFFAEHIKSKTIYAFADKSECLARLKSVGASPGEYKLWYGYSDMARKPYSSGYAVAHRAAALAYYHRNKNTSKPRGRPAGSKNKKKLGISTEG